MEYSKPMTERDLNQDVDAEIARRDYLQKNMQDLPPTYQQLLPRPTGRGGDLSAAEHAIREQFRLDQEHVRRAAVEPPRPRC